MNTLNNLQLSDEQLGQLRLLAHSYSQSALKMLQNGIISHYTYKCIQQDISETQQVLRQAQQPQAYLQVGREMHKIVAA